MYVTLFKSCNSVCRAYYLVTDLTDLCIFNAFTNCVEVFVSLEVNNVVCVEICFRRIVFVLCVSCLIGTCAHRNLNVSCGLNDICHKVEACKFNAELAVCNINAYRATLTIVVLRSNCDCEVPDSLGSMPSIVMERTSYSSAFFTVPSSLCADAIL